MSIYGYFNCHDCHQMLWVGKALQDTHGTFGYHMGGAEELPLWKREVLNRVLWKFLAEHTGHRIDVRLEHEMTEEMFGYQEIGGDSANAVTFENYLAGWRGFEVAGGGSAAEQTPQQPGHAKQGQS